MDNYIVAGIFLVVVMIVIRAVRKKLRGQRGCCGSGSDYMAKKKKLSHVVATKTFKVDGMHCEKCSNRVMEVVNDIEHVAGVVDLKQGIVTVSYEQEVPDELIKARIQRVGYTVTGIY